MKELTDSFVEHIAQCWGCRVFDNLFGVVSNAGAAVYVKIANICFTLFAVMFVFYVIWAVWKTLNPKKPDTSDKYYTKTVIRVTINSLIVLALLGFGIAIPKFVSRFTFEPVANITLVYTQTVLKTVPEIVDEQVRSAPLLPMSNDGIFRPELRDTIVEIMKTTITLFQKYMKLGLAVIDKSFTWSNMFTISGILRNIIYFILGLYLFYGFFKLFLRFCFYFVDVIVNMALFSFLFPLGLILLSFRGGPMPKWISSLGKGLGTNQIRKVIGSIVALGAAVITYIVIMVIIARFFSDSGTSVNGLMDAILSENVFASDLSDDNLESITLVSMVVLLYVVNYLFAQIPQIKQMILSAFNVTEENKMGEQMANDAKQLYASVTAGIKNIKDTIVNKGETPEGKTADTKGDTKSDNKGGTK